jgi:AraC-like DNA-binding protein
MEDEAPRAIHADFYAGLRDLAAEREGDDLLYASASGADQPALAPSAPRPLFVHVSECTEIAVVREGSALIATPGQISRLSPGRLFVIGYGVHHAELPGSFALPHRIFWCHVRQDRVILADSRYDPSRGLISPEVVVPSPAHLERIAQTICAELAARSWGYPRAVFGLLTYLSSLLARRIRRGQILDTRVREAPAPSGGEKAWMAIEAALDFCERNFSKGITRNEVAQAVGYSPSHLGHLVSRHLGRSLSQHLNNLRISHAKRLLEESDLSIRQIASFVGYADPAHFTRAFTRALGVSPTAYRRQAELR